MKYLLGAGVAALLFGASFPALSIPPPPSPVETLKNGELGLGSPILFVEGTDQLMTTAPGVLDSLWFYLRDRPEISLLRIEGHTAGGGDPASAQRLSERRALAVGRYLIEQGIDCKRLIAVGFGASRPLYDSSTPQRRAYNQRITFVIAALRGKAIGGLVAGGGRIAGELCTAR